MDRAKEAIERGLALFGELAGADALLLGELEASRGEFGGGAEEDSAGADRRHLEWFVLERPSERLEGIPVEALAETWSEAAGPLAQEALPALLGSRAGAFQVTSVEAGRGVWIRDLLGVGELPVSEPGAAADLIPGDLLVGRIFPMASGEDDVEGTYHLSPAVACFRDPVLVEALEGDLERQRRGRRGPLRMTQLELERLFFQRDRAERETAAPPAEAATSGDPVTACRRGLRELGLGEPDVDDLVAQIERARTHPEGGRVVTELLNGLAFETDIDLDGARRLLVALWNTPSRDVLQPTARSHRPADVPRLDARNEHARNGGVPGQDVTPEEEARVREALEAFDAGRARGEDLEQLFGKLEEDLGLAGPGDAADDDHIPDFPGAVGAMVEEFLWEVGREDGPQRVGDLEGLRSLGTYGERIGVFENLRARDLLDYAGRWLLDEGPGLPTPAGAARLVEALRLFARWSAERQDHELAPPAELDALFAGLARSLPRVVAARALLGRSSSRPPGNPYRVVAIEEDAVLLRDEDEREIRSRVGVDLAARLAVGDLVHGRSDDELGVRLLLVYPPELERLLERRS